MPRRFVSVNVAMLLATAVPAALAPAIRGPLLAQDVAADSSQPHRSAAHDAAVRGAIGSVLLLGVAAVLDRPMRATLRGRGTDSPVVAALSTTGNTLGTASHLVPAMAGAFAITVLDRSRVRSLDVVDAAAGYAATDIVAGLLKSAVGRERPIVHGDPGAFHPFTSRGDYHSFPSGHMTHITALATAAAIESHDGWVRDAGVGATLLVGWQRLHADQHWTSDVVGGILVSHWVSSAVVNALRRRQGRR